jgi:hypothetical protein
MKTNAKCQTTQDGRCHALLQMLKLLNNSALVLKMSNHLKNDAKQ